MKAADEHWGPGWPSSTFGTSYGIARSRSAAASTSRAGTNRNSGLGSMNRVISHGQAMRSTRARSRVIHLMMSLLSQGEDDDAGGGADGDEHGLGDLEPPRHHEGGGADHEGGHVDDGAPREDETGARDRARRGRGDAGHEALHFGVGADAIEPGKGDDDEQVDGQEHPDGGCQRAGERRHQVADERHRDDDPPGRYPRAGDGIEELLVVEPA